MGKQISIIMGAYNCEKTLAESLDSILNQTYKDFSCYVCDDGSSDGTASVIKAYAEKDSRIIFMQSDRNCGLAVTLNRLIALCRTPYIARMDGDDIAEPNRLEKQLQFLESHPEYDLCGSAVRYFDETGFWGEHIYPEEPERKNNSDNYDRRTDNFPGTCFSAVARPLCDYLNLLRSKKMKHPFFYLSAKTNYIYETTDNPIGSHAGRPFGHSTDAVDHHRSTEPLPNHHEGKGEHP